jgi:hypothetical protein
MPEMGEPVSEVHIERESNMGKWILLALAIIYVAGSLFLTLSLRAHLDTLNKDYAASKVQIAELTRRVQSAEANDETLAQQVGITKREMASRASEIQRQQRAAETTYRRTSETTTQSGQRRGGRCED